MNDKLKDGQDLDLLCIGRGYSIATYLAMSATDIPQQILPEYAPKEGTDGNRYAVNSVGIIGGYDSWSRVVRGDGTVNHALDVYSLFANNRTAPTVSQATKPATIRDDNQAAIETAKRILKVSREHRCPKKVFDEFGLVHEIIYEPMTRSRYPYRVVFRRWAGSPTGPESAPEKEVATIFVRKIIYGAGSGPHSNSYQDWTSKDGKIAFNKTHCMDLDAFMRMTDRAASNNTEEFRGKSVTVVGSNAGLDALVRALAVGMRVTLLMSYEDKAKNRAPNKASWLETNHYKVGSKNFDDVFKSVSDNTFYYNKSDGRFVLRSFPGAGGDDITATTKKGDFQRFDKESGKYVSVDVGGIFTATNTLKTNYFVTAIGQSKDSIELKVGEGETAFHVVVPWVKKEDTYTFDLGKGPPISVEDVLNSIDLETIDQKARLVRTGCRIPLRSFFPEPDKSGGWPTRAAPPEIVPIYDDNLRFASEPKDYIIGLRHRPKFEKKSADSAGPDTEVHYAGIDIIGAAAVALASKEQADKMKAMVKALAMSGRLIAADQLGAIRAQIQALTGFDFTTQLAMNRLPIDSFQNLENFITDKQRLVEKVLSDATLNDGNLKDRENRARAKRMPPEQVKGFLNKFLSPARDLPGFWRKLATLINPNAINPDIESCATYYLLAYKALRPEDRKELSVPSTIHSRGKPLLSYHVVRIVDGVLSILSNEGSSPTYGLLTQLSRTLTNMQAMALFRDMMRGEGRIPFDFNGTDRTQIAVLCAELFPSMQPYFFEGVASAIISNKERPWTDRPHAAWGYNAEEVERIWAWLAYIASKTEPFSGDEDHPRLSEWQVQPLQASFLLSIWLKL